MEAHIYKPIKIENGNGEPIKVCPSCFGDGVRKEAPYDCVTKDKRVFGAGQVLTLADQKQFKRSKIHPRQGDCKECGGAGMVKCVVSHG